LAKLTFGPSGLRWGGVFTKELMAKRFTETKIWDDMWFQELPVIWKCLWWYLFSKCDEAGIWKVNHKLAEFQIGQKIKWDEADKYFNKNKERIKFNNGFWIIAEFVTFQYGDKVCTSEHPFHQKIRGMLDRVSHTLSDRVQVKDKVKDKDKNYIDISYSNKKTIHNNILPKLEEVSAYCKERKNGINAEKWFNFYSAKGWMIGRNKMKDWKAAVRTWEEKKEAAPIRKAEPVPVRPEVTEEDKKKVRELISSITKKV